MRRVAVLAVILVMALSGVAQAKADVAKVTGTYSYFVLDEVGNPSLFRTVSLGAQATDPVKGTWSYTRPSDISFGTVTCLRVDGADAWLAGPATFSGGGLAAVFIWVHDGGTPGSAGDAAFLWGSDPGETLDDMEALCENKTSSPWYELDPFTVVSGNLTIHPAR
jgi:hypothetical protein